MKRLLLAIAALGLLPATILAQNEEMAFRMPRQDPSAPAVESQAPTVLDTFEYNGYMKIGTTTRVCVTDTKSRKSYWLTLDGPAVEGIRLQQYLRKGESIIISSSGVTKQLDIKKPKIEQLRVAMDAPPPPQGVPPGVTTGVAQAPAAPARVESDEEVRIRMQKVAEEIRRRRAERRQMIEQRQQSSGN